MTDDLVKHIERFHTGACIHVCVCTTGTQAFTKAVLMRIKNKQISYSTEPYSLLPSVLCGGESSGSTTGKVQRGEKEKDGERRREISHPLILFWSASLWTVRMDSSCRLMQELGNVFGFSESAAEQIRSVISLESCLYPASQPSSVFSVR